MTRFEFAFSAWITMLNEHALGASNRSRARRQIFMLKQELVRAIVGILQGVTRIEILPGLDKDIREFPADAAMRDPLSAAVGEYGITVWLFLGLLEESVTVLDSEVKQRLLAKYQALLQRGESRLKEVEAEYDQYATFVVTT